MAILILRGFLDDSSPTAVADTSLCYLPNRFAVCVAKSGTTIPHLWVEIRAMASDCNRHRKAQLICPHLGPAP